MNIAQKSRERSVQCASPSGLHRMTYTEWGDPANPQVLGCVHGLSRNVLGEFRKAHNPVTYVS